MIKRVREATAEYATSETMVWWDMDNCPLPNGYDPSRVAPRIDTELKSLGYNGPLTIVAGGNLCGIPNDFLKALSSTGVVLSHTTCGLSVIVPSYLRSRKSQSPMSIMLITTNYGLLNSTIRKIYMGKLIGYNLLLAYPPSYQLEDPHPSSLVSVGGEWLWDRSSLLKVSGLEEEETRRLVDTRSCEMFSCSLCLGSLYPTFEDFFEHLGDRWHKSILEPSIDDEKMMIRVDAENLEALKQSKRYIDLLEAKKLAFESYHKHLNDAGIKANNIMEIDNGKYVRPFLHMFNESLKNENTNSESLKKWPFGNEEAESPLLHMIKEAQKKKDYETLKIERQERKMNYEKWIHQHSSEPEKTLMAKANKQ